MEFNVGGGKIVLFKNIVTDNLMEQCPYCGFSTCYYSCDESKMDSSEDQTSRIRFNSAIEALTCFLLTLQSNGVIMNNNKANVENALQEALDSIGNNF